jgi:hypothetical protein
LLVGAHVEESQHVATAGAEVALQLAQAVERDDGVLSHLRLHRQQHHRAR